MLSKDLLEKSYKEGLHSTECPQEILPKDVPLKPFDKSKVDRKAEHKSIMFIGICSPVALFFSNVPPVLLGLTLGSAMIMASKEYFKQGLENEVRERYQQEAYDLRRTQDAHNRIRLNITEDIAKRVSNGRYMSEVLNPEGVEKDYDFNPEQVRKKIRDTSRHAAAKANSFTQRYDDTSENTNRYR